jgi:hypothetical protein
MVPLEEVPQTPSPLRETKGTSREKKKVFEKNGIPRNRPSSPVQEPCRKKEREASRPGRGSSNPKKAS